MLDIHDRDSLEQLLERLRLIRSDHQWVEAKASRTELPKTLWQSVSAFANSETGGVVLLGIDEGAGTFDVVGVDDPARIGANFAALCQELDPPVRPPVHHIEIDGKVVIAAVIVSLPRSLRPCHKGDAYTGSYIRVADRDDRLTRQEVDELLQGRVTTDSSARPAPPGAKLDPHGLTTLLASIKASRQGKRRVDDATLLVNQGATLEDGAPTLAGFLALGVSPESKLAAARVAYRELPESPESDKRFVSATHAEGTIGEILDQLLALLSAALKSGISQRGGKVRDELDVPRLALREVIGNALMHRSLAPGQDGTSALVEVSATRVLVTNPGGIPATVNLRDLGTSQLSKPRNLQLTRVCEMLTTPAGERITEGQASGIRESDRECHRAATAPALFASKAALFSVLLLRGPLPTKEVLEEHQDLTDDEARLTALAKVLAELREDDPAGDFAQAFLDETLATRALANSSAVPTAVLTQLETNGVLRSRALPDRRVWDAAVEEVAAAHGAQQGRRAQLAQLVEFLREAPGGELRPTELRAAFGLSKSRTALIISAALDAGLIEPTTEAVYNPRRAYRLTVKGSKQPRP